MAAQVPVHEGRLAWSRGRTWYRVVGDLAGPSAPLVCLHGGPGSTHHYFAPLEQLGAERAVVVYDQLGCGRSDRPRGLSWSLAVFLEELDALRAELGLRRVHLLGTSWGGMLALEHALARRHGLASLILSSTLASAEEWAAEARRLRDALPPAVVAVLDRHEGAASYDDPEYERALRRFDERHVFRGARGRPELERMLRERAPDVYRAMWGPNEWTIAGALAGWDVRPRLRELDVPALVVRGAYDLCTEAIARTLVAGIAGAREVVLQDSSHMPVLEEPERYVRLVGEFVAAAERAA